MKTVNKINFLVCALAVLISFSMAACDNDPQEDSKSAGAAVDAPTLDSKTHNSITINAVTAPTNGQTVEYAINTADNTTSTGLSPWQDGLIFSGLIAQTNYYIFARSKEDDTYRAGTPSDSLSETTDADPNKSAGAAVDAPTLDSKTHNSITINAVTAPTNGQFVEYAYNTTDTIGTGLSEWQTGVLFENLIDDTVYYIFARSQENATHNAGDPSDALVERTLQDPAFIHFDHITLLDPIEDSAEQGRVVDPAGSQREVFFISNGKKNIHGGSYEVQFALDDPIDISSANYFAFDMMVSDIELLDDISGGLYLWFSSSDSDIWVGFGAAEAFDEGITGAVQDSWFRVNAPIQQAHAYLHSENLSVVKEDLKSVLIILVCGNTDPVDGRIYFRNFQVE